MTYKMNTVVVSLLLWDRKHDHQLLFRPQSHQIEAQILEDYDSYTRCGLFTIYIFTKPGKT